MPFDYVDLYDGGEGTAFNITPEKCMSKIQFETEEMATRAASASSRKYRNGDWRAFECPRCGFWHIGRVRKKR